MMSRLTTHDAQAQPVRIVQSPWPVMVKASVRSLAFWRMPTVAVAAALAAIMVTDCRLVAVLRGVYLVVQDHWHARGHHRTMLGH
jgi:hypothetical protein